MFKLERLNVVKVVATEHERNKLLAKGFTEVKEQKATKEATKEERRKTASRRKEPGVREGSAE